MEQPIWNFEQEPYDEPPDETSYNFRAYLDRIPDEKIQQYSVSWTNERVIEWDGNFTNEGALLIACSERDIEIEEFRRELEKAIEYRNRVRPVLQAR